MTDQPHVIERSDGGACPCSLIAGRIADVDQRADRRLSFDEVSGIYDESGRSTRPCSVAPRQPGSRCRKRWGAGDLTARRFRTAIADLLALPIVRFPTGPLMARAYELRANVTPYGAAYVGLAESLGCTLLTADARLSRAPGIRCDVEVLTSTDSGDESQRTRRGAITS